MTPTTDSPLAAAPDPTPDPTPDHAPDHAGRFAAFADAEEVRDYLRATSNTGRWGPEDQRGAVNLITAESRVRAAALVSQGLTVSMSRPLATELGPGNPRPVHHYWRTYPRGGGAGTAHDYFAIACHGSANTHIDALTHVWDVDGALYNGVEAADAVGPDGATWGALDQWADGIVTRCVLLDVPRHRGTAYVTVDEPVHAAELEEIRAAQGVELRAGDAVAVYSGRDRWDAENPVWGSEHVRAGLDVSCVRFLREYDVSVLLWDMTDRRPVGHGLSWGVHAAVPAHGLVLVDQARLETVAGTCADLGRWEFLLTIAPLFLRGGTGSPVNPIAVF